MKAIKFFTFLLLSMITVINAAPAQQKQFKALLVTTTRAGTMNRCITV